MIAIRKREGWQQCPKCGNALWFARVVPAWGGKVNLRLHYQCLAKYEYTFKPKDDNDDNPKQIELDCVIACSKKSPPNAYVSLDSTLDHLSCALNASSYVYNEGQLKRIPFAKYNELYIAWLETPLVEFED